VFRRRKTRNIDEGADFKESVNAVGIKSFCKRIIVKGIGWGEEKVVSRVFVHGRRVVTSVFDFDRKVLVSRWMGSVVLILAVETRWYVSGLTIEGTSNIMARFLVRLSCAALTGYTCGCMKGVNFSERCSELVFKER